MQQILNQCQTQSELHFRAAMHVLLHLNNTISHSQHGQSGTAKGHAHFDAHFVNYQGQQIGLNFRCEQTCATRPRASP
eukprot:2075068-Amphidinium_carterae.1